MISKQTAFDLWVAYDEIAKGEKLLSQMQEQLSRGETVDLRDSFGRSRGLQLGIPSGESGHRLFDVHPTLAIEVIRAHVAQKKIELTIINERAKAEAAL